MIFSSQSKFAPWVDDAAKLPLAFAQVREDSLLDERVLASLGGRVRVMMIASGGCTVAALAASERVSRLHFVDPNPAQIALTRIKLRLLQNAPVPSELRSSDTRRWMWRSEERVWHRNCGHLNSPLISLGYRISWRRPVRITQGDMSAFLWHSGHHCTSAMRALTEVLQLRDPEEQARRVAPSTPLGRALEESFCAVLALPNLARLFGAEATKNPVESFAQHFLRRTRHAFATLPAADNPFLWQMLACDFPPGNVPQWLAAPSPAQFPEMTWTTGLMNDALADAGPGAFDFVHLSNILDWLAPAEAGITLARAWTALRIGGRILIRQLNSALDIPALGPQFDWDAAESTALHAADRSFFYRRLHLGKKR